MHNLDIDHNNVSTWTILEEDYFRMWGQSQNRFSFERCRLKRVKFWGCWQNKQWYHYNKLCTHYLKLSMVTQCITVLKIDKKIYLSQFYFLIFAGLKIFLGIRNFNLQHLDYTSGCYKRQSHWFYSIETLEAGDINAKNLSIGRGNL